MKRKLGNGKVAHLGFSFGGNFSAMTGLCGAVDAAIVLGGPIDKAWGKENAEHLPFGMPGIIGNDMGFDHQPTTPDFMAAVQQFSRRPLLARTDNAPMLVINGANDYFVPQADTLAFKGRPKSEVYLLPDIGHCAVLGGPSKLPQVIDLITRWLPQYIGGVLTSKLELDTRLDPRIKKYFAGMPQGAEKPNVSSREELLAQENSPAALAALAAPNGPVRLDGQRGDRPVSRSERTH